MRACDRTVPRTVTLLRALVLGFVGAQALMLVVARDVPASVAVNSRVGSETIVRRFYAPINEVVETGVSGPLESMVTAEFLDEMSPGREEHEC